MSRPYISAEIQAQVLEDAGHLCGYCHSDERITGIPLSIEHIIPRVADGPTVRENLWRFCRPCNEQKGTQRAAADPETSEIVPLYNPRTQPWRAHFQWSEDGALLIGLTPEGRATIAALQLNRSMLAAARRRWVLSGWHPPDADRGAT
jgi:hypothetical protein